MGKIVSGLICLCTIVLIGGNQVRESPTITLRLASAGGNAAVYGQALTLTGSVNPAPGTRIDKPSARESAANPIVQENKLPGTSSWQFERSSWPSDETGLAGYPGAVSVNDGQSVRLFITDDGANKSVTLSIYRMGWYQGLGGRLIETIPDVSAKLQPPCTTTRLTRMVSCANWKPVYTLQTEASWVSGVYLIKLTDARQYNSYIPLIVRDDQYHATYLLQDSVNTWQAYNFWGGHSIYASWNPKTDAFGADRGYAVSFDRPYWGQGAGDFMRYELPQIMWFEENGYDVSYQSDLDSAEHPASLLNHHAVVVLGHSEYWPDQLRSAFQSARDKGISLAFLGGNDMYWRARYSNAPSGPDRILICYKLWWLDPNYVHKTGEVSTRWRDQPNYMPENELMGTLNEGTIDGFHPYVVDDATAWAYQGTHASVGEASPGTPIGGEFDSVVDNGSSPPGLTILGASPTILPASPVYAPRELGYVSTCSHIVRGNPTSLSTEIRSSGPFSVQLILERAGWHAFTLKFQSWGGSGEIDGRTFAQSVSKNVPSDGVWHSLRVNPAAILHRLKAPKTVAVVGVWVSGDADVSPLSINGYGPEGQKFNIRFGPDCAWTSRCPSVTTFCQSLGWAGVIDGTARPEDDATLGTFEAFRASPPVADTTLYQASSGALVFSAGSYDWGSGLVSTPYDPNSEWSVIQLMMGNVINRMGRKPVSLGELQLKVDGHSAAPLALWDDQSSAIDLHLTAGVHHVSAAYEAPGPGTKGRTNHDARASIRILPAQLTVTADNATMVKGASPPKIKASFSGFVSGDSTRALHGSPKCWTDARRTSAASGPYETACSRGSLTDRNYRFVFVPGVMYVFPRHKG